MDVTEKGQGRAMWFAARTRYGQELKIKQRLEEDGVEHFIPTRESQNYRHQKREKPVINNLVFLRATQEEAVALKTEKGLPFQYLFDYANHTMLVVPDKQMEDFQRVFDASIEEGGLVNRPIAVGEKVKVVRGPLKGVEGNILETQGAYYVVVSLCGCVSVRAKVPVAYLEK